MTSRSDTDLVRHLIENPPLDSGRPRWSIIGGLFGLGSTSASRLCERFGCDPDTVRYCCPWCGLEHDGHPELGEFCRQECIDEFEEEPRPESW